ncbi:MAG: hypothetical protein JWN27_1638 [Candidatus Eremiobacteraeota bacterium]|nr:hypothetical protein [Candidatus Eremiobacteraeota bacterium]
MNLPSVRGRAGEPCDSAREPDADAFFGPTTKAPSLSSIFRLRFLQLLARRDHGPTLSELRLGHLLEGEFTATDLFARAYELMLETYRCEYVFKNEIVRKLYLARHDVASSSLISEFKVAQNRADLLVVNGTTTVYEVKTRYDVLDRLPYQLTTYLEVFDRVIVVADAVHVSKILAEADERVGVISFTARGTFHVERAWTSNSSRVVPATIFDCLHVPEYTSAVKRVTGFAPEVPNTRRHRVYRALFETLSPGQAHRVLVDALRSRYPVHGSAHERLHPSLLHLYFNAAPAHRQKLFSDGVLSRPLQLDAGH